MQNENASHQNDFDFTLTHSYTEAEELLVNGWEEKIEMINKIKTPVTINKFKKTTVNDFVGFVPNVPNAIQNIPKTMITDNGLKKNNFMDIFYDMGSNWSTKAEDIQEAAISLLKAIQILEKNKIRVKLKVSIYIGRNDGQIVGSALKLKEYNETISLYKILFPMCHPSFFRRIGFRWLETCPFEIEEDFRFGYGSTPSSQQIQDLINAHSKEKMLTICFDELNKYSDNEFSPEKTVEFIMQKEKGVI